MRSDFNEKMSATLTRITHQVDECLRRLDPRKDMGKIVKTKKISEI